MGRRRMVLVSLGFYTFGVGIAGFSPSIYFLLFSRAVQGVGFAIVPLSLAIITDTFPKEKIAAAQGVISGTFAIGAAAGLIIGSYVVQDLGWQYAFHSAFVLSIVLAIIVWRVIKPDVPGPSRSVDFVRCLDTDVRRHVAPRVRDRGSLARLVRPGGAGLPGSGLSPV